MTSILHIRSSSGLYGAENVILTLMQHIHEYDCKLAIIHNYRTHNDELYKAATSLNLTTYDVPCNGRFDLNTLKRLYKIVRDNKIACIHTHDHKSNVYGILIAKYLKIPILTTLHGWITTTNALVVYNLIEKAILKSFSAIVTVSQDMEKVIRKSNRSAINVLTIANGVDTVKFSPHHDSTQFKLNHCLDNDSFLFCTVSRLSPEKGLNDLIRAFHHISDAYKAAKLIIIGDGPDKDHLKALVSENSLDKKIFFLGTRTDIDFLLNSSDCYISASHTEGMPMSILEAMATSLPIIATDVGDVGLMLSNNSGILIQPKNKEDLIKAMQLILDNKNHAAIIANNARQRCLEHYSAAAQAEKYQILYKNLINKRPQS